jgi:orotidine-5'-phosphate decarboxylase
MRPQDRIFVAIDTPDALRAKQLARRLAGHVGGLKIGLELFTAAGPAIVREIREVGLPVFLDLKLHDIPTTVAGAAGAAARLGIAYLTIHALGGAEMIRRAAGAVREAAAAAGVDPPALLGVTVLTSHADSDLDAIGLSGSAAGGVERLATLARDAGANGLVCASPEIAVVRRLFPGGTLVVPGIRPLASGAPVGEDQARVATPARALALGADRIVIGRPITQAADPVLMVESIAEEIRRGDSR